MHDRCTLVVTYTCRQHRKRHSKSFICHFSASITSHVRTGLPEPNRQLIKLDNTRYRCIVLKTINGVYGRHVERDKIKKKLQRKAHTQCIRLWLQFFLMGQNWLESFSDLGTVVDDILHNTLYIFNSICILCPQTRYSFLISFHGCRFVRYNDRGPLFCYLLIFFVRFSLHNPAPGRNQLRPLTKTLTAE